VLSNCRPRSARDGVPVHRIAIQDGRQHRDLDNQLVCHQYTRQRSKQPHFTDERSRR